MMDVRRHEPKASHANTSAVGERLAAAFGYGRGWSPAMNKGHADAELSVAPEQYGDDGAPPDLSGSLSAGASINRMDGAEGLSAAGPTDLGWSSDDDTGMVRAAFLTVQTRGRVMEGAVKLTGGLIPEHREWRPVAAGIVLPRCRMDVDALGALAYAKLHPVPLALLRVYAGEFQHWPVVERWMCWRGHRREAAADGMNKLLWKRPDVTATERAKLLHVRKHDYLIEVRAARYELLRALRYASAAFERAMGSRVFAPGSGGELCTRPVDRKLWKANHVHGFWRRENETYRPRRRNRKHPENDLNSRDQQPAAANVAIPLRRAA